MLKAHNNILVGVFEDRMHAQHAMQALRGAGFGEEDLQLVQGSAAGVEPEMVRMQQEGYRGGILGTLVGGGAGAVLGAVLMGVLTMSGGWTLLGAFFGLCAGAALGVYAGPFIAMEAEEQALETQPHPSSGEENTVVLVHCNGRVHDAEAILLHHGAYDDSMRAR